MPTPPSLLRRALLRLRAVFLRDRLERDMHLEMREHLDRATERLMARGMSERDARLEAKREFGNLSVLQDEARDIRGARWAEAIVGDTRFALRYFARHKTTTAIIVVVLALGTGANTMIFSLFQSQFIRPAPAVPSYRSQVKLWARERATRGAQWHLAKFTRPELTTLAARRDIFSDIAGWTEDEVILQGSDSGSARGAGAQFVTPNFFRVVGVSLEAGQGLRQDAGDEPDHTAIVAHAVAEQLYGSATAALGKRVLVNEVPMTIVGVAPKRFQGAMRNMHEPALWMPLSARADVAHVSPRWYTEDEALELFGRLAPGVSRDRATAFARQVSLSALPDSAARIGMTRTAEVLTMNASPPGDMNAVLAFTVVSTIGILVLLVACMNVSSLMVAAAVARRHEIAVRLSLGASRVRLLRQLVTESTLLALGGGLIGLTVSWWVLTYAAATEIDGVDIAPDLGTFAFVLVLAVVTGVLFGLSPAMHATRAGVSTAMRDSGTGASSKSRLQRSFVVAQIALSQPLLVLLATMLSMMIGQYRPLSAEMSRHVIAAQFTTLEHGSQRQSADAVDSLIPRIAARPNVVGAVPEAAGFSIRGVIAGERRVNSPSDSVPRIVHIEGVAPGWFSLVDVPILLGRDVSLADTAASDYPVVIGSDLARMLWGSENPVGRRMPSPPVRGLNDDSTTMIVVGVYDASKRLPGMTWNGSSAVGTPTPRLYTAVGKHWRHDRILVRTRGPAEPMLPDLQAFVRMQAPALPVTSMLTLEQIDQRSYQDVLQTSLLAGAGGALALILASLGLYGVVSLAVRQRNREIGIRIAVGAHPMRVARMFLVSGVRASVIALALGLPVSVIALRLGQSNGLIIAPDANPYVIGVLIALILVAVASAATWIPARRAALVDPAKMLRVE